MKRAQYLLKSKIAALYLVASEKGLQGVYKKKQNAPLVKSLKGSAPEIKILAQAATELSQYFAGKRQDFGVALDIATGTPFQKRVWQQLRKIPYGKTSAYRDIAERIHHDRAVRAVGSANGKNPLSIIVPCHRVIAADGTLGGYAGGLKMKTQLLELERKFQTA